MFSVRIAGNVVSDRVLGSLEYACQVAGAKLVVVLGHTQCGAVTAAADLLVEGMSAAEKTGCEHLDSRHERDSRGDRPLDRARSWRRPRARSGPRSWPKSAAATCSA